MVLSSQSRSYSMKIENRKNQRFHHPLPPLPSESGRLACKLARAERLRAQPAHPNEQIRKSWAKELEATELMAATLLPPELAGS